MQVFLAVEIFVAAHTSDRICDVGRTVEDTFLAAAPEKCSRRIPLTALFLDPSKSNVSEKKYFVNVLPRNSGYM